MSDTNTIRPWMTFDYVNRLFHLPPMYLKETLQIRDLNYPNISIRRYANTQEMISGMAIDRIANAIRTFTRP